MIAVQQDPLFCVQQSAAFGVRERNFSGEVVHLSVLGSVLWRPWFPLIVGGACTKWEGD
jgi:hypothetical protein